MQVKGSCARLEFQKEFHQSHDSESLSRDYGTGSSDHATASSFVVRKVSVSKKNVKRLITSATRRRVPYK